MNVRNNYVADLLRGSRQLVTGSLRGNWCNGSIIWRYVPRRDDVGWERVVGRAWALLGAAAVQSSENDTSWTSIEQVWNDSSFLHVLLLLPLYQCMQCRKLKRTRTIVIREDAVVAGAKHPVH